MRLYPHLQDTGGFFVAVLQKAPESVAQPDAALGSGAAAASVEEKHSTAVPSDTTLAVSNEERPAKRAKVETAEETAIAGSSSTQQQQGQKKKEKGTGLPFKEEPYTYLSPDNAEVQSISQVSLQTNGARPCLHGVALIWQVFLPVEGRVRREQFDGAKPRGGGETIYLCDVFFSAACDPA